MAYIFQDIAATEVQKGAAGGQTLTDKIRNDIYYAKQELDSQSATIASAVFMAYGTSATASATIDTTIDWRSKMITVMGVVTAGSAAQVAAVIPAGSDDKNIGDALTQASAQTWDHFAGEFMYSEDGGGAYSTAPYIKLIGVEATWYIWVDSTTGDLKITGTSFSNGSGYQKIAYNLLIISG